MTGDGRELVTLDQAVGARPYLTKRHLRRLIAEHRIPSYRIGGKVLVDVAEVDELVAASRRDAS
jgi:excisionase family DNA binding protein